MTDYTRASILTLGELETKLKAVRPREDGAVKRVVFNFPDTVPTRFVSWRGSYSEIALGHQTSGYGGKDEYPDVAQILKRTSDAIGSDFEGWKGGTYTMTRITPVWVNNPGDYAEYGIVDVIERDFDVLLVAADTGAA